MLEHDHSVRICLKCIYNKISQVQRIAHALIFYPHRCKKNSTLTTGEHISKRALMFLQVIQKIHPRQVSGYHRLTWYHLCKWLSFVLHIVTSAGNSSSIYLRGCVALVFNWFIIFCPLVFWIWFSIKLSLFHTGADISVGPSPFRMFSTKSSTALVTATNLSGKVK